MDAQRKANGLRRSESAQVAEKASRSSLVAVSREQARIAIDQAGGNLINAEHALKSNLMQVSVGFRTSKPKGRATRSAKPRRRAQSPKPSPAAAAGQNVGSRSMFELPGLNLPAPGETEPAGFIYESYELGED
jgi:hypothetical protein